jgi:hypothetical protein
MDLKFQVTASARTDEELLNCIENRQIYLPETIEASVAELQSRGHEFSEAELSVINEDIKAHRENADIKGRRTGFFGNYKNNIVQDPDAPLFYSRRIIYAFTFFFGALFGSILLAVNINKTNNPVRIVWILLFGIGFTVFQIVISEFANAGNSLTIVLSIIAAYIMESFFWNRFIGNATFYRAKPIWVPLIIGIVIAGMILMAIIYGNPQ